MGISFHVFLLTSWMAVSWSGVQLQGGLFQLTRQGVGGEGVTARCLARRVEFHQVGGDFLTALRARDLVFAQSLPPILTG